MLKTGNEVPGDGTEKAGSHGKGKLPDPPNTIKSDEASQAKDVKRVEISNLGRK